MCVSHAHCIGGLGFWDIKTQCWSLEVLLPLRVLVVVLRSVYSNGFIRFIVILIAFFKNTIISVKCQLKCFWSKNLIVSFDFRHCKGTNVQTSRAKVTPNFAIFSIIEINKNLSTKFSMIHIYNSSTFSVLKLSFFSNYVYIYRMLIMILVWGTINYKMYIFWREYTGMLVVHKLKLTKV